VGAAEAELQKQWKEKNSVNTAVSLINLDSDFLNKYIVSKSSNKTNNPDGIIKEATIFF